MPAICIIGSCWLGTFWPEAREMKAVKNVTRTARNFVISSPKSELQSLSDLMNGGSRQELRSSFVIALNTQSRIGRPAKLIPRDHGSTKLFLTRTEHLEVASPSYPRNHCLAARRFGQKGRRQPGVPEE